MILVDSNVPMHLVGAAHPHKTASQRLLQASVVSGERLVTDVEVLQEILHRYVAIRRRDAIQPAFDALSGVVDEVFPIERRMWRPPRCSSSPPNTCQPATRSTSRSCSDAGYTGS